VVAEPWPALVQAEALAQEVLRLELAEPQQAQVLQVAALLRSDRPGWRIVRKLDKPWHF